MKIKVVLILFLVSMGSAAHAHSIEQLRKAFHSSVLHPDQLSTFLSALEEIQTPSPIEQAYLGAAEALKARASWNPIMKISHLSKFRDLINEALQEDASNLEIRFLRYSIEFNIPKLLRSEESMHEDKNIILSNIANIDHFDIDNSFIIYILTLFEDTKACSLEEIEMIKSKLM